MFVPRSTIIYDSVGCLSICDSENISIPENLDFDNLEQSDNSYNNATGDELIDILDIGIDF